MAICRLAGTILRLPTDDQQSILSQNKCIKLIHNIFLLNFSPYSHLPNIAESAELILKKMIKVWSSKMWCQLTMVSTYAKRKTVLAKSAQRLSSLSIVSIDSNMFFFLFCIKFWFSDSIENIICTREGTRKRYHFHLWHSTSCAGAVRQTTGQQLRK